jgi:hypothetical protein
MVAAGEDASLAVALAEYEFLREHRRLSYEGSAARFNSFLLIASGGTAVVAGLLGAAGGPQPVRGAAAGALGGVVLLVGFAVFVRLVHYQLSAIEQAYHMNLLRTFLLDRAPALRPYSLLPTIHDVGAVPFGSGRERGLRGWSGLPQTVGLVNSVLVALAGAVLGFGLVGNGWVAGLVGVALGVGSAVLHHRYEQRLIRGVREGLDNEIRSRFGPAT